MNITRNVSLRWNDFHENTTATLTGLRFADEFTDITLACDDNRQIKAHRVIMAASSPVFHNILKQKNCLNPIVFLRGITTKHLIPIIDFIYQGEVKISEENLDEFLKIAKDFQLTGLESEAKSDDIFENVLDKQSLPGYKEEIETEYNSKALLPNEGWDDSALRTTLASPPLFNLLPSPMLPISSPVPSLPPSNTYEDLPPPSTAVPPTARHLSPSPLMEARNTSLTPEEAFHYLTQPARYTRDLEVVAKAKGGQVFLFKSDTLMKSKDWRIAGYVMTAEKGKQKIHSKLDKNKAILKGTFKLVTNENKDGDIRFRKYSWQFEDDPKTVLIQYVGDETLAGPVVHGNCKGPNPIFRQSGFLAGSCNGSHV